MIFISAPFGNYLHFNKATSVHGTFTVEPRKGRLKQIFKTLRYVKTASGRSWRNKLGLRNPGLQVGMLNTSFDSVLSVAAIDKTDWTSILKTIGKDRNIELNVSCPNLDSHDDTTTWEDFDKFPKYMRGKHCIVKIPPNSSNKLIDKLIEMGYKQIHASNTLPTEQGGLSGKILVPYTLSIIKYIKNKFENIQVIAGGGITSTRDAKIYLDAGADHISLGSVCFTPWKIKKIINETT